MDKSEFLKLWAIQKGLCEQWTNEWGTPDDDGLIKKYLRGIDFCFAHDYPNTEWAEQHFDKAKLNEHGIWINQELPEMLFHDRNVALGKSHGNVLVGGFRSQVFFVKDDCDLNIHVCNRGCARVFVHSNAKVSISVALNGRCYVYQYGGEVKGTNILLRDKRNYGIG